MNAKKLIPILENSFKNDFQVLLRGKPGAGKTSIIEQAVKNLGYDLITDVLSIAEPTDFKGLPCVVDGKAQFLPYANLQILLNATKPTVYFVDDLGWAPPAVQNCFASLLWKRELNGVPISKFIKFVSATNNKNHGSHVNNLSLALLSRFHMVLNMEVEANDWIEWAIKDKQPAELIAYIKNKNNMLDTFTGAKEEVFACPRTVANLGYIINAGIIDFEAWVGTVGNAFAIEFKAFYDMFKSIGNIPNEILVNPTGTKIDFKPDILYFIMIALNNRAIDVNKFNTVMIYIERLDVEFQAFFIQMVMTKYPRYKETQTYISWITKNQSFIQ